MERFTNGRRDMTSDASIDRIEQWLNGLDEGAEDEITTLIEINGVDYPLELYTEEEDDLLMVVALPTRLTMQRVDREELFGAIYHYGDRNIVGFDLDPETQNVRMGYVLERGDYTRCREYLFGYIASLSAIFAKIEQTKAWDMHSLHLDLAYRTEDTPLH